MANRTGHTEPFESGQQSNAKDKGEKVKIKSNVSKMRNAGNPDPLADSLKGRDSYIPSDNHTWTHSKTSKSGGAHYNPSGEFGRPKGNLGSKATNPMGGHGGKGSFGGNY